MEDKNKYIEPITAETRGVWPSKWIVVATNPDDPKEVLEFDSIDALNRKLFELKRQNEKLISAGDVLAKIAEDAAYYKTDYDFIKSWNDAKSYKSK